MNDVGERLAVLETDNQYHKDTLGDVVDQLKVLNDQVTVINSKLDKNAGFLAGVAFVFTMVGAFIGTGGATLLKKLMGD
jgi:cytochrome c biogenesis protein CcdA